MNLDVSKWFIIRRAKFHLPLWNAMSQMVAHSTFIFNLFVKRLKKRTCNWCPQICIGENQTQLALATSNLYHTYIGCRYSCTAKTSSNTSIMPLLPWWATTTGLYVNIIMRLLHSISNCNLLGNYNSYFLGISCFSTHTHTHTLNGFKTTVWLVGLVGLVLSAISSWDHTLELSPCSMS